MNDFFANNIITIWVAVFVFEVLMGMLAQTIAEKKGHARRWFWAGFFLSFIGVVWAAGLPDETIREELKRLRERHADATDTTAQGEAGMGASPMREKGPELAAVLAAAVAAMGEEEGKKFVMRSFRPAGEGSTAWNRAGRGRAIVTHR